MNDPFQTWVTVGAANACTKEHKRSWVSREADTIGLGQMALEASFGHIGRGH